MKWELTKWDIDESFNILSLKQTDLRWRTGHPITAFNGDKSIFIQLFNVHCILIKEVMSFFGAGLINECNML